MLILFVLITFLNVFFCQAKVHIWFLYLIDILFRPIKNDFANLRKFSGKPSWVLSSYGNFLCFFPYSTLLLCTLSYCRTFFCCTLFYAAFFPCCLFLILHSFQVALFHDALILCCPFLRLYSFTSHLFPVAFLTCCNLCMLHLPCCNLSMLHFFHVVFFFVKLFSRYIF